MDIDELKELLMIDGDGYDIVLPIYQSAAETYLTNAGVVKNYANAQYKIAVRVMCLRMIEDPALVNLKTGSDAFVGIITQLAMSQG